MMRRRALLIASQTGSNEAVKTIRFYVKNNMYTAENWMTWFNFIDSEYNSTVYDSYGNELKEFRSNDRYYMEYFVAGKDRYSGLLIAPNRQAMIDNKIIEGGQYDYAE